MKDFTGRTITAGNTIALAVKQGSAGCFLTRRYVREVREDHIRVSPTAEEPKDRRQIGRITGTHCHTIIIDGLGPQEGN